MNVTHSALRNYDPPETLLCLHSSGSSGRQWRELLPLLSPRFDVQTPNLLGYDSEAIWSHGMPASLNDEADNLAPLLERAEGGVHLLGHSFGGAVALQMALRWPARIRSLTLYEPVRFGLLFRDPVSELAGYDISRTARHIGLTVLSGGARHAAEMFVEYWSGSAAWAAMSPRQQQNLTRRMPKISAEFQALFSDQVPDSAYADLDMPVSLMSGTQSPASARQVVDLLATRLPRATVVSIAGMGHMAPVTDVGTVARHLPAWLTCRLLQLAAA